MTISNRYQRLLRRRAPPEARMLAKFSEAYEKHVGEATKYLLGAMRAVDSTYTKRMVEQGDRVENQLTVRLKPYYPALDYRRQGSVSNFTHIRYYSDVDILVIIDTFVTLEAPQQPTFPYTGDCNHDLLVLRAHCKRELASAFHAAKINDEGATCIVAEGGSLACPVDVVPSNWFDTNAYKRGDGHHTRGIMVLNKKSLTRAKNFPFLFNFRLEEHDKTRFGAPRMLIRLLKSIKADHEEESNTEIGFSSFDICSLIYRMPDQFLSVSLYHPLDIIRNLLTWIESVTTYNSIRESLAAIDDSRLIFDKPEKLPSLKIICSDLKAIYNAAVLENGGYKIATEDHLAAA